MSFSSTEDAVQALTLTLTTKATPLDARIVQKDFIMNYTYKTIKVLVFLVPQVLIVQPLDCLESLNSSQNSWSETLLPMQMLLPFSN